MGVRIGTVCGVEIQEKRMNEAGARVKIPRMYSE